MQIYLKVLMGKTLHVVSHKLAYYVTVTLWVLYKDNCLIEMTGHGLDDAEFHCGTGNTLFVCPKCPDHQCGPASLC
jgi:hypothetical protein